MTEEARKRLEQHQQSTAVMVEREEQSGKRGGGGEIEQGNKSPSRSKRKSTRRNKIESSAGGESPKVPHKIIIIC